MVAKERANSLLKEYPYTGSDWIYELLDHFGIICVEDDLDRVSGVITEVGDRTVIIVDRSLSSSKKREIIAHELGHYFFHTGNMILYKKKNSLEANKDERKAQEFALYLLVPEDKLRELLDVIDPPTLEELADEFGVTVEFMKERLSERFCG